MTKMTVLAAAALLLTPGCVVAVDGGGAGPKRLEANGEAAVKACGVGQVALVTNDGYVCKGAPDSAVEALRASEQD